MTTIFQASCPILQLKNVLKHYNSYPNRSYSPVPPRTDSQSYLEKTNNEETIELSDRMWRKLELGTVERNAGFYLTPQCGVLF